MVTPLPGLNSLTKSYIKGEMTIYVMTLSSAMCPSAQCKYSTAARAEHRGRGTENYRFVTFDFDMLFISCYLLVQTHKKNFIMNHTVMGSLTWIYKLKGRSSLWHLRTTGSLWGQRNALWKETWSPEDTLCRKVEDTCCLKLALISPANQMKLWVYS